MITAAGQALTAFLDPTLLVMLLAGVLAGAAVGVIPGLGGTGAVALLLPFVYQMDAARAMALLVGAVAVVHTSDTIGAVLLGAPGSASAAVTMMDGHALARQGQAGRALSVAFLSSMAGGLLGAIGLTLSIPIARPLVLAFGAPELLLLSVIGLSLAASLSEGSLYKAVLSGLIGVFVGTIGAAPNVAVYRFTFGQLYLYEGLPLVGVALGIFGLAEIASLVGRKTTIAERVSVQGGWRQGISDFTEHWRHVLRGALVGIWAGVLPGIGATAGTWMAYGQAVATSKDKRRFGKGDVRGIIGPESANNAVEAGDLIPTLLFGIPGGVPAAMMLGALLVYGIQPGPRIVTDHLDLLYTIVWSFALANVLGAALCFLLSPALARLTYVRFSLLAPALLILMFVGGFSGTENVADILVMIGLGVVGWVMKQAGYPRAPLLIGYVLSQPIERYYFLTVNLYPGTSWLLRPWTIALGILLVGSIVWSVWSQRRSNAEPLLPAEAVDGAALPIVDEDEDARRGDLRWSVAFDVFVLAIFAFVLVQSFTFPGDSALLPRLIGAVGTPLALLYTVLEIRKLRATRGDPEARGVAPHPGLRSFLWMLLLLGLIWVFGWIIAALIFVPVLLLLVARSSKRTALLYTGGMIVVLLAFGYILGIDLNSGLLTGMLG